ncbi:MAG: SRPBCC domain-containing protein [Verrucomicrobiae bacterium]|nr:SRPBCC domain-containing protein [Verrucomicrobiae bacterium]
MWNKIIDPMSPAMDSLLQTNRILPFSPDRVYGAFADAKIIAAWWGPDGFTNEIDVFEFTTGGRWIFTMVGPNGARYRNQNIFLELTPAEKVVIRHDGEPYFTLSIRLNPHPTGTILDWQMQFDDPSVMEAVRHIVVPANEQNLDRLTRALTNSAVS